MKPYSDLIRKDTLNRVTMKGQFNKPIYAIITSIALLALVIGLSSVTSVMAGVPNGGAVGEKVCSELPPEKDFICKEVFITDEQFGNGQVDVNELVFFDMIITVDNDSSNQWNNIIVKDRLGAQLEFAGISAADSCIPSQGGATSFTKGKTEKVFLVWTIGTLIPGESAVLQCRIVTDTNTGGQQSYTECGLQEFNSGANLKFTVPDGSQRSFETGPVFFEVFCNG